MMDTYPRPSLGSIRFCRWCNEPAQDIHSCRQMWQAINSPERDTSPSPSARIADLERIVRLWDRCIAAHQASLGVALWQRDRAQAEMAAVRQDLARLEREGVAG